MSYRITTDTTCDLPASFYKEHNIPIVGLSYRLQSGEEYTEGTENNLGIKEFYDYLRNGRMA